MLGDHPNITLAKRLSGWVQKNGNQSLLTFNTIYAEVGWVGQKPTNLDQLIKSGSSVYVSGVLAW